MSAPSAPRPAPLAFGWGGVFLGAAFVAAAASQIRLQIFAAEGTIALGERANRFMRVVRERARRGSILTRDGRPLAEDAGQFGLTLVYAKVPSAPGFYTDLAAASGIPATELPAVDGSRSRTWPGPISAAAGRRVEAVRRRWRADGLSLSPISTRVYPAGALASGIVGVQKTVAGKKPGERRTLRTGLEASRQDDLQGRDGRERGLTDRTGRLLPLRTEGERVERADGKDVWTTLDSALQTAAAEAIRKSVVENKAEKGVAIVLDPTNGDVLAMANWPSYDPGSPSGTANAGAMGLNPAFQDRLYPGSTFKILSLAMGLEEGKVTMDSVVRCAGTMNVGKTAIRCLHASGMVAHGPVAAVQAIAESCNVSAATWALRVGRERFLGYMDRLGLLKPSELGLPGEIGGLYNRRESAQRLQLATFGFGQSLTLAPVALAGAFGAIANDGVRMEPRLVRRVGDADAPIEAGERVFSSETAASVRRAMEAVIQSDEGTGAKLRIPGYRLAGKTGTAQRQRRGQSGYVASFIGLVPARAPRAVVLVMVDHPQGSKYYGAEVAGPVFRTLARSVIERFRIPPDSTAGAAETAGSLPSR